MQNEITQLEERLRLAELGPDPAFFQEALDEQAVVISQTGEQATKDKIVEAHRRAKGPKFRSIEMSERRILDHGTTAVVTCKATYEGPQCSGTLKFMRVWLKKTASSQPQWRMRIEGKNSLRCYGLFGARPFVLIELVCQHPHCRLRCRL